MKELKLAYSDISCALDAHGGICWDHLPNPVKQNLLKTRARCARAKLSIRNAPPSEAPNQFDDVAAKCTAEIVSSGPWRAELHFLPVPKVKEETATSASTAPQTSAPKSSQRDLQHPPPFLGVPPLTTQVAEESLAWCDVSMLRATHSYVTEVFKDGEASDRSRVIGTLTQSLQRAGGDRELVPPLEVAYQDGVWWSLSSRRLVALQVSKWQLMRQLLEKRPELQLLPTAELLRLPECTLPVKVVVKKAGTQRFARAKSTLAEGESVLIAGTGVDSAVWLWDNRKGSLQKLGPLSVLQNAVEERGRKERGDRPEGEQEEEDEDVEEEEEEEEEGEGIVDKEQEEAGGEETEEQKKREEESSIDPDSDAESAPDSSDDFVPDDGTSDFLASLQLSPDILKALKALIHHRRKGGAEGSTPSGPVRRPGGGILRAHRGPKVWPSSVPARSGFGKRTLRPRWHREEASRYNDATAAALAVDLDPAALESSLQKSREATAAIAEASRRAAAELQSGLDDATAAYGL
uniref:Uncharacterized protein n=1 Tax=Chromera velia CCMP2878 TaxID=1169474 RepID=A0A0G4IFP6_9ALVE|eukprot:Cvel_13990.t1-p1 / transcript=Cvel_13990.t1 / gene=Cvel_13990 / organism=Chromera_velia_CCMP2878 / gene_product=hypothetical protein / transcript_product=hypothetical protein / location=Cvel_scaffold978:25399-26958(-) / protein_length=520 / sequence_SO=supercontig / SO=protein_coding / is_pseudo=false